MERLEPINKKIKREPRDDKTNFFDVKNGSVAASAANPPSPCCPWEEAQSLPKPPPPPPPPSRSRFVLQRRVWNPSPPGSALMGNVTRRELPLSLSPPSSDSPAGALSPASPRTAQWRMAERVRVAAPVPQRFPGWQIRLRRTVWGFVGHSRGGLQTWTWGSVVSTLASGVYLRGLGLQSGVWR